MTNVGRQIQGKSFASAQRGGTNLGIQTSTEEVFDATPPLFTLIGLNFFTRGARGVQLNIQFKIQLGRLTLRRKFTLERELALRQLRKLRQVVFDVTVALDAVLPIGAFIAIESLGTIESLGAVRTLNALGAFV